MAGKGSLGDLLAKAGLDVHADRADGAASPGASDDATSRATDPTRPSSSATGSDAARGPDLSRAGKLVLRRERKGRGGKTVTVLDGAPAGDLSELARAMKKALGCGATVEGGSIVLLGDLSDRARDWLAARGARRVVVGN
ncbi:MAG: translation initiation factor [Alphaproteobacteria bacterium]